MTLAVATGGCDGAVSRGGPGGGNSATVNGSVGGVSISAMDQFAITTQPTDSAGGSAIIVIGSLPGVCAAAVRNEQPKNLTALTMLAFVQGAESRLSVAPTAPGTFEVPKGTPAKDAKAAGAFLIVTDEQCESKTPTVASDGKIELTHVGDGSYTGTYDFTFGSEHLTGSFDVPNCAGASVAGANKLTCI
jgi:hypothetical protein